jgi:hypothetical protein
MAAPPITNLGPHSSHGRPRRTGIIPCSASISPTFAHFPQDARPRGPHRTTTSSKAAVDTPTTNRESAVRSNPRLAFVSRRRFSRRQHTCGSSRVTPVSVRASRWPDETRDEAGAGTDPGAAGSAPWVRTCRSR